VIELEFDVTVFPDWVDWYALTEGTARIWCIIIHVLLLFANIISLRTHNYPINSLSLHLLLLIKYMFVIKWLTFYDLGYR
jgi:hypothetical protein